MPHCNCQLIMEVEDLYDALIIAMCNSNYHDMCIIAKIGAMLHDHRNGVVDHDSCICTLIYDQCIITMPKKNLPMPLIIDMPKRNLPMSLIIGMPRKNISMSLIRDVPNKNLSSPLSIDNTIYHILAQ